MKGNQKGLSLVELMISITVGLILLTGVMKVFLSSKTTYSNQQALSRVQETGRLAIEFLSRDIRMAGYIGCSSRSGIPPANTLNSPTSFKFDFSRAVVGYTASTLPSGHGLSPAPLTTPAVTDVISLQNASGTGIQVTSTNDENYVYVKNDALTSETNGCGATNRVSGFCVNDIVMVADCTKARVFQITDLTVMSTSEVKLAHVGGAATVGSGNAIASWGAATAPETEIFKPGAEVMTATNTTYYIATGASGRPSLYQRTNGAAAVELLEGVEDISIRYGLDATPAAPATPDFNPETYETAATINTGAQWPLIRSVRIEILVASIEDNVLAEKQKYTFKGAPVTASDKRLRQVFSTTIGIRSRLI